MDPTAYEERRALLRELFGAFGDDSEIRPPLQVDYGYRTTIGARTFANFGFICLDVAEVTIGANTVVGAGSIVTKDLPANVVAVGNPRASSARSDGASALAAREPACDAACVTVDHASRHRGRRATPPGPGPQVRPLRVARLGGGTELADPGAQLRLVRAVALGALRVGQNALLLRLDVRHVGLSQ